MPLPTPQKNESQNKFIARCLSNKTMKKEYPKLKQRQGICYSQWKNKENAAGQGQGIGKPAQGIGGFEWCKCPECGYKLPHIRNTPCTQIKCPKCGKNMTGSN